MGRRDEEWFGRSLSLKASLDHVEGSHCDWNKKRLLALRTAQNICGRCCIPPQLPSARHHQSAPSRAKTVQSSTFDRTRAFRTLTAESPPTRQSIALPDLLPQSRKAVSTRSNPATSPRAEGKGGLTRQARNNCPSARCDHLVLLRHLLPLAFVRR